MRFTDELQRYLYYVSQIDYSYWRLKEIMKHSVEIESPISALIDKATGYDEVQMLTRIKEVKYLAGVIVRCKKKIDFDPADDARFLRKVRKIEQLNRPKNPQAI